MNGELDALKPEPVKEQDGKKKKPKKGAKKEEPKSDDKEAKPKKSNAETI